MENVVMSIREDALQGKMNPVFEKCAANEGVDAKTLMEGVAKGIVAIPKNNNHDFERVMAVGKGLSVKVNANIGASKDMPGLDQEIEKLCVCLKAGADTVMDLSMGENLNDSNKRKILNRKKQLNSFVLHVTPADAEEFDLRVFFFKLTNEFGTISVS